MGQVCTFASNTIPSHVRAKIDQSGMLFFQRSTKMAVIEVLCRTQSYRLGIGIGGIYRMAGNMKYCRSFWCWCQ